ncbi:rhodanese-like domain-containing protein [Brevibacillus massiliensis]|uniref:rhodanese-like domain-containing protein n=1 Tax=Brevibacillus massiliensis TaxID=1118054 RepID=UPI00030DCC3C|nr:rhodanese-like domain-containing protein [Brevibacillus massiliensis]
MEPTTVVYMIVYVFLAILLFRILAPIKGLKKLTPVEFIQQTKASPNKMVIDVREPHEYKSGHLEGAVNIPVSKLKSQLGGIPKETRIFLYCRSGMRSRTAGRIFLKNGFAEVAHLHGGILGWEGKIVK